MKLYTLQREQLPTRTQWNKATYHLHLPRYTLRIYLIRNPAIIDKGAKNIVSNNNNTSKTDNERWFSMCSIHSFEFKFCVFCHQLDVNFTYFEHVSNFYNIFFFFLLIILYALVLHAIGCCCLLVPFFVQHIIYSNWETKDFLFALDFRGRCLTRIYWHWYIQRTNVHWIFDHHHHHQHIHLCH